MSLPVGEADFWELHAFGSKFGCCTIYEEFKERNGPLKIMKKRQQCHFAFCCRGDKSLREYEEEKWKRSLSIWDLGQINLIVSYIEI